MAKIQNYLQDRIVKIGRQKGYVTSLDMTNIFGSDPKVEKEMQKLVKMEFFESPIEFSGQKKWELKRK